MSKEWLWWLGEFGLAAVVAVVAGIATRDIPISILYGLFAGTVFFILREHKRVSTRLEQHVDELEDKTLNLPTTASHLEGIEPYFKQILRSERNDLLRMAREATNREIVVHSRPVTKILFDWWKMVRPGDRVIAVNTGVGWGTPQHELLRQLNFDLVGNGADITRIFIEPAEATIEDKERLIQEMDKQKGRIKVRYIKESQCPPDTVKSTGLIVDKIYGITTYSKAVGSGIKQLLDEVYFSTHRDVLDKAKDTAENLIKLSEEYK